MSEIGRLGDKNRLFHDCDECGAGDEHLYKVRGEWLCAGCCDDV